MKYLEDGNICKMSSTRKKRKSLWDLEEDVGKFTEEAVFTPHAVLQGQRTWGMGTTRQPFPTSRKQRSVATAKHSTTWACVMNMAEAPPGTSARCGTSFLVPRLIPCAVWPRVTSRNEQWAGLGESPLLSPSCEGKIRKKLLTSRNLDSKLRQARALVFFAAVSSGPRMWPWQID